MELLILSACGLVANKYVQHSRVSISYENAPVTPAPSPSPAQAQTQTQPQAQAQAQAQTAPQTAPQTQAQTAAPAAAQTARATACPTPIPNPIPIPIPTPNLGSNAKPVQTKTTQKAVPTRPSRAGWQTDVRGRPTKGKPVFDEARYNEQYSHPQDPNPNVPEKPWMRMANAPYKPKEEIISEIPGPQDVLGRGMNSRVKQMESDFVASTVPVTSEKQFDRPVEQISTGNGSAAGFHIGSGLRYHKFLFNDQPTIEVDGGPRGSFAGPSGTHVKGDYRTVTQRSSLSHQSMGPPMAVGIPQSSAPLPSFEITASHMESYKLDPHASRSLRAPVPASASLSADTTAFQLAHDEKFNVLDTSLETGGERFATGASGYRDAKLHVPLNNEPVATYEQRVVPNFKIAKASDWKGQDVTARQMMIPEMSQNVSALRKDRRPPVSGSTTMKNSSYSLMTDCVKSGAGAKGSRLVPAKVDPDCFLVPTDRIEAVGEKATLVSTGASASNAGRGSRSVSTPSPAFRTTESMSELVGTPFIRGAGGKRASKLDPIHEEAEVALSEMETSAILRGLNKVSSAAATTASPDPSSAEASQDAVPERADVFAKSAREPILVEPVEGILGKHRTGAANVDARGIISDRGLVTHENTVMRPGKPKALEQKRRRAGSKSTKSRKLSDVLNTREKTPASVKTILGNPYALPAASRHFEV